jgi:hypothetical protein
MARGDLGHSRRIDLAGVLALVNGQETGRLLDQVMAAYAVGRRSARQVLADLAWGGYVVRQPDGGKVVALTSLGRSALTDDLVADELVSLPKRHRLHRSALRDIDHPDHAQALLDEWRREIRRR